MDRLSFCRQHLEDLEDFQLLRVYSILSEEYDCLEDKKVAYLNNMDYMEDILDMIIEWGFSVEDWFDCLINGNYDSGDNFISIGYGGVSSFNELDEVIMFVAKKLNGETMEIVENCLSEKGIINN